MSEQQQQEVRQFLENPVLFLQNNYRVGEKPPLHIQVALNQVLRLQEASHVQEMEVAKSVNTTRFDHQIHQVFLERFRPPSTPSNPRRSSDANKEILRDIAEHSKFLRKAAEIWNQVDTFSDVNKRRQAQLYLTRKEREQYLLASRLHEFFHYDVVKRIFILDIDFTVQQQAVFFCVLADYLAAQQISERSRAIIKNASNEDAWIRVLEVQRKFATEDEAGMFLEALIMVPTIGARVVGAVFGTSWVDAVDGSKNQRLKQLFQEEARQTGSSAEEDRLRAEFVSVFSYMIGASTGESVDKLPGKIANQLFNEYAPQEVLHNERERQRVHKARSMAKVDHQPSFVSITSFDDVQQEPDAGSPSPSAEAEAKAQLELWNNKAQETLTPPQMRVFQLKMVRGLPIKDVGSLLGMRENTVNKHISDIRKRLKPLAETFGVDLDDRRYERDRTQ